jgi:hypothetical protein
MDEFESMKHYLEMDYKINLSRVKLGFQDIVLKNFQFLIDDFGFHCAGANLLLVKYESENVFIRIYHDRLSYELELYFGLRQGDTSQEESYTLIEVMNLTGHADFVNFEVTTREEMMESVFKMASLFKQYASRAIIGEKEFYDMLAKQQIAISHNLMVEYTEKFIGKDVEIAWEKKDYKEVVKLYEMYENFLTKEQMTKFKYAKEQLKR